MKKKLPLGFELFSRRIPEPFNNIYIYHRANRLRLADLGGVEPL